MSPELRYLTTLLSAELVIEAIEGLQDQPNLYRHKIKQFGQPFQRELMDMTSKHVQLIWGKDDAAMYALIDYQKQVIQQVARMRPEDIGVVKELIDIYNEDPEGLRTKLGIAIVDSDQIPADE